MTEQELKDLAEAFHTIRFILPIQIVKFTVQTAYRGEVEVEWSEDFEEYMVMEVN